MTLDKSVTSWSLTGRKEPCLHEGCQVFWPSPVTFWRGKGFKIRQGHGPSSSPSLCNSPIPQGGAMTRSIGAGAAGWKEDSQFAWTHRYRGVWLLACISPLEHRVLSVSASWKLSHTPWSRPGLMPWNRHVHSLSVGTCPRMAANIYKHRCSWQVFCFWGNCLLAELLPAHLSALPHCHKTLPPPGTFRQACFKQQAQAMNTSGN